MKTIRISDETHKKLTEILGKLTAETGKMQHMKSNNSSTILRE